MKKIAYFLLFLLPATMATLSCQGLGGHSLKGSVNGAANLQVLLEQVYFDQNSAPVALGRVSADASGNFAIEQKEPFAAGLYRLTIGAKRMFFVLSGEEKEISFKGDINTIEQMQIEVSGSEMFTCYANVVKEIVAGGKMTEESAKAFAQKGCNPLMRAFFTTQIFGRSAGNYLELFKAADKALQADMPESKYATDFSKMVSSIEQQITQSQAQPSSPILIGAQAPEISLPGPDGKVRSLSAMKGKVVLLDFWASWCRPCRMANPHVVEMYNKYKSKGFDVFSVSLDRPGQKDAWVAAIQQDGLVWDNHVSDLQYWNSAPAGTYGVRSIPSTFLIDREGKIVALNPRNNLEEELLKVLN